MSARILKTFVVLPLLALFLSIPVAAAPFVVDTSHTVVGFKVRHLGISWVDGNFGEFEGVIEFDPEAVSEMVLSATVQVASVNTGNEKRDDHLRNPDFFDVEKHPLMTFQSKKAVEKNDLIKVTGDLTLHGVTREVELEFELGGLIVDPWGNERIGLSGSGKIDRQEFGLKFNQILETGQLMVGNEVRINLEIEGVRKK